MAPSLPNLKGCYLGAGWEPALMFLQQEQGDRADLPWHCRPWPQLDWNVVCQAPGGEGPLLTFLSLAPPSLPFSVPPPPSPLSLLSFLSLPLSSIPPPHRDSLPCPSPSRLPSSPSLLPQAVHASHPQPSALGPLSPLQEADCGERGLKVWAGPVAWD